MVAAKDIVDKDLAREFILYAENDYPLYGFLITEWYNNFARKIGRGTFDKQKAIEGLAKNYVPLIARRYAKDFGGTYRLSAATKLVIAKAMMGNLINEGLLTNNKKGKVTLNELNEKDRLRVSRGLAGIR